MLLKESPVYVKGISGVLIFVPHFMLKIESTTFKIMTQHYVIL
jgi:hypothetical protein